MLGGIIDDRIIRESKTKKTYLQLNESTKIKNDPNE